MHLKIIIMNLADALSILSIDSLNIDLTVLKKKYHKLALQHHPDKNGNTPESTAYFQKIGEAYEIVKREIKEINNISKIDNDSEEHDSSNGSSGYMFILNMFLKTLFKDQNYEIVTSILKDIVSVKLFESVDKETCIHIYDFIIKYKIVLHISEATLNKVRDIILEKYKDVQIFILNPSLADLFENKIYKLQVDGHTYFVPLWHHEMVFQNENSEYKNNKDSEIIVKCIPELPENVEIDENNNLIVNVNIPFTFSLFQKKTYSVLIHEKYEFQIPLSELCCKVRQIYVLKKRGISQIIESDIFNIFHKGDIIFKILFTE